MHNLAETLLILILLADLGLLVSMNLRNGIRLAALQGVLFGLFLLSVSDGPPSLRLWLIALAGMGLKGVVFPILLRRAIREAGIPREMEPFVGPVPSVLSGVLLLAVSLRLGAALTPALGAAQPLAVPASLMTLFTGLFLIVSRRKALTQALGYIVLENGIAVFGAAGVAEVPALVELGILLDAFVAVFVMGVAIHHINREFDHIEADRLSSLKG